ncbi:protein Spindly [Apis mellifera]|uniref:Protein Spindly n=1 Tax=Apis mellifera TaxID=7460 RepID=A0A7M7GYQ1_APIME|nr:protein Spindly [Apis mellifera]|eukprot:XP_006570533.1 protein Spindly [Apis mellifera]
MSTQDSTNVEEYIEEYTDIRNDRCYKLLQVEYEKCKQEIHNLKRRLELNEVMLREAQEANELLERSLEGRILEKEQVIFKDKEKYHILTKDYENIISNLEKKLAQQTQQIEELRQNANQCIKTECNTIKDQSTNLSLETDNISLRNHVDELLSILREEKGKNEHAEKMIEELKTRCDNYEYYTQSIKEELHEKDQTLEEVRAELILKRAEMASLQMDATCESRKGNSLFAEVEDRRQNIMSKMNVLREKYMELKRVYKSQTAELKMLKAERVATFRKWENDTNHISTENEELIQKYKNRISDLESKLKCEIKKNDSRQLDRSDTSFGYFQSLLDTKRKETDELRTKIEDFHTKFLIQEETKLTITKQLNYWRCKALSLEAQICAAQAELKMDLANHVEHKILEELNDVTQKCNNDNTEINEKQSTDRQGLQNSAQSFPLNNSVKIKHTSCSIKNLEDYENHNEQTDKENSNQNNCVKFKNLKPKKSCKFEDNQNANNNANKIFNKLLHSMENITIEESKNLSNIDNEKYPIVHISN